MELGSPPHVGQEVPKVGQARGRTGSGLSGAAAAKAGREPLVKFVEHLEGERGRSEALTLGEVTKRLVVLVPVQVQLV